MKGLKDYLAEVEAMQFVTKQAKPQGKRATQADAAHIEYHSAEDSAEFWKAVHNPVEGAIDMSHLSPEEIVKELAKIR